ncbi:MAG: hypothetical protein LBH68_03830 [Bifidobacteriaceae bacterium]|jgi:hypothetical protein|nr:hypothetical protein [Bifidobacteriaceae bacterium]
MQHLEWAQAFVQDLPSWLQWAGIGLIAAVPFIESYLGSAIGVAIGIHPIVAVAVAIAGNTASMLILVLSASRVRGRIVGNKDTTRSPRRQKLAALFNRYGVAGVSLIGQTVLPSQITSAAMVSFGASRTRVIVWQIISITLWGIAFGTIATLGLQLISATK